MRLLAMLLNSILIRIEIKHGGTWWRPKKVLISKHAVLGIRYWKDQETLNKEILGEDYAKGTEESNE